MKYLLFLFVLFATTAAHSQCSEFDNLLKKGDNYLKSSKPNYQEAINAYTAAILACSGRAGEAKQRITRMVNDISKLKENAVAAEKKAEKTLKTLQKANEDFVERFLQNARKDASDGRCKDALEKIKSAQGLDVLKEAVYHAYMENADSSLLYNQFEVALECVKAGASFGILSSEEIGRAFLGIAEKSISNLRYEIALESTKNVAALGVLKPELSRIFLEIAFWHGETGNIRRAAVLLDSLADFAKNKALSTALRQTMPTDTTAARNRLRETLKLVDPDHFKFLFEQKYYPDMVFVQGGKFRMGCDPKIDPNCERDEILHEQELSSFHIARTETTVWQFALYCAAEGININEDILESTWSDPGNNPVVNVQWFDAVKYANWMSKQKGENVAISKDDAGEYALRSGYRLPTEAEWEYAAKGGSRLDNTIYSGGNDLDDVGWYSESRSDRTYAVGKKKANALGLYDMSGNVWEWCWDWYGHYKTDPEIDYKGPPEEGSGRVLRGGSWDFNAGYCRAANRYNCFPGDRYDSLGFRLVFVP